MVKSGAMKDTHSACFNRAQRCVAAALLVLGLSATAGTASSSDAFKPPEYVPGNSKSREAVPAVIEQILQSQTPVVSRLQAAVQAESSRVEAMAAFNQQSVGALQNGLVRWLQQPVKIGFSPLTQSGGVPSKVAGALVSVPRQHASGGSVFWSGLVHVEGAWRVRLKLENVAVPPGARWWVAGANGIPVGPFGQAQSLQGKGFWTPSVAGDEIRLMVQLPATDQAVRFDILRVGELFALDQPSRPSFIPGGPPPLQCYQDAQCFDRDDWDNIDIARSAVGRVNFQDKGVFKVCSGGLIADSDPDSTIPYFLTANHCIGDEDTAASVEVWWDYRTGVCGGSNPDPEELAQSIGASLVVSSEQGDFALLKLDFVPGSRWFLGWDRREASRSTGTLVHRVSHPRARAQAYSTSIIGGEEYACSSWPRPGFIYQSRQDGLIAGGSSGAPLLSEDGLVLGQLSGLCGAGSNRDCDDRKAIIDGALSRYWSQVSPWLGTPCSYRVVEPVPGSQWARGSQVPIRWVAEGDQCAAQVRIRLLRDGQRVGLISRASANDGEYLWTMPPGRAAGDEYDIRIEDLDQPTIYGQTSSPFSIVKPLGNPACRFSWLAPLGAQALVRGSTHSLLWDSDGANCDGPVRIRLLREGEPVGVVARQVDNSGEFVWLIPPGRAPGDRYQLRLSRSDGGSVPETSDFFTITRP